MTQPHQIPLNALRVFDAVVSHMSFTKAGETLGITQTAVSHQIRLLEELLGAQLFHRRTRRIELTELGARLAPRVSQAFGLLDETLRTVLTASDETLVISTTPTFAAHWLAPRIGKFQLAAPRMAVRMTAGLDIVDFSREPVDVAIRYGVGGELGLVAHELMRVDYAPMLSPRLLADEGPIREPRDLLRLRLIDPSDPWWRRWFDAAGVPDADLDGRPLTRFGSQTYEANSAIAGHGVAILTPAFYRAELAAGLLVQPFPLACDDGRHAYRLLYPETRRHQPKIRMFRDWLLQEIAEPST
ncbi:LysR substrate-binding domain-containing protein [Pinisolibacter sp.]|uniref:LysR substrate-binding domain-containing protein n=1 Tax=Pinisolibacter sp. TaxID=2172024 RepID=UPI002FDD7944